MEAQHSEWILNLLKAHSGEPLLTQVAAEAIRRRDAELLEKVEGMRWAQEGVRYHYGAKDLTDEINAHNLAIDDVIKLIKGE